MEFCKRLISLLEEREMTQRELSADLHIASTTLNGYIKGNREPDYGTLVDLAKYFEVSTDYLLGMTNVRKNSDGDLDVREGDLVGLYRSLQPEKQDLLIEQAHLYHRFELKKKDRKKKNSKEIK